MKITCKACKKEVKVSMYFYDERIERRQFLPSDPVEYRAVADGKAICPACGADICERFSTLISDRTIVWLAMGGDDAE